MEIVLNKKHWFMLEKNLLNSVNGNMIQSQAQWEVSTNQEIMKKISHSKHIQSDEFKWWLYGHYNKQ